MKGKVIEMKNEKGYFEFTDIVSSFVTFITFLVLAVKILQVIL